MGGDGVCYAHTFSPMTQRLLSSIVKQVHWPRAPRLWPLSLGRDELCCHSLFLNRSLICHTQQKGRLKGPNARLAVLLLIEYDLIGSPHKPRSVHPSDTYALARTPFCLYSYVLFTVTRAVPGWCVCVL